MAKNENNLVKINKSGGPSGFVLFVSYIGASVYFVNQVDGFWNIVGALCKGAVWPAILVYNLFQTLGA